MTIPSFTCPVCLHEVGKVTNVIINHSVSCTFKAVNYCFVGVLTQLSQPHAKPCVHSEGTS